MPQPPITRQRVFDCLQRNGPCTVAELAALLNLTPAAVRGCLGTWRKDETCPVYVSGWNPTARRGKYAPVYDLGKPGRVDRPKPPHKTLSPAEIDRRYYERHRALILAKHRARRGSAAQEATNPFSQLLHAAGAVHSASKRRE